MYYTIEDRRMDNTMSGLWSQILCEACEIIIWPNKCKPRTFGLLDKSCEIKG